MAVVYHWKHGWIPLTHEAALQKAHGSHAGAAKLMADAPHATGIKSRQDVAKAALDLPNVPASHRAEARSQLHDAAAAHNSTDLLPRHAGTSPLATTADQLEAARSKFDPQNRRQLDKLVEAIRNGEWETALHAAVQLDGDESRTFGSGKATRPALAKVMDRVIAMRRAAARSR